MKIIKATEGFKLMTYGFVDKALNHCATLLGYDMGKEKIDRSYTWFYCKFQLEICHNMKVSNTNLSEPICFGFKKKVTRKWSSGIKPSKTPGMDIWEPCKHNSLPLTILCMPQHCMVLSCLYCRPWIQHSRGYWKSTHSRWQWNICHQNHWGRGCRTGRTTSSGGQAYCCKWNQRDI